jgi:3-methylcrotonyl-CoA carboxylase alpha subunit
MLDEFAIGGLKTNIAFLRRILAHPAFAAAELDTGFIPRHQDVCCRRHRPARGFWEAAAEAWLQSQPAITAMTTHSPWAECNGLRLGLPARSSLHLERRAGAGGCPGTQCASTWQLGRTTVHDQDGVRRRIWPSAGVARCTCNGMASCMPSKPSTRSPPRSQPQPSGRAGCAHERQHRAGAGGAGQVVEAGTALVVLEAMKMEHSIRAPHGGTVKALFCQEGDMVSEGTVLVELEE